jgi:chromosome segregation ATPase
MGKIVMAQLTPEELQSIKELQARYDQTVFELGSLEAQLIVFDTQIDKLKEEKRALVSDLNTLGKKESELVKSLQEKYGTGNINTETGEVTSTQQ